MKHAMPLNEKRAEMERNMKLSQEMEKCKMTREEAIKIMDSSPSFSGAAWIARFEALGLIKFDEPREVTKLCSFEQMGSGDNGRIELWPEGYVFWLNGEIVYRSWKA